ncbi:phosphatidate cytidylyltransferase [Butyrivibrio sp. LC3010]|uniref:phosphatidate cytidylyltransferase n=1 Tax=Butyrivibrio sp. LC3010 TaxID=1280680 RepID=UPI0003F7D3E8|nr:phosphatidate cytidylyltransferase [Butyrivibrio sp. LC3010]
MKTRVISGAVLVVLLVLTLISGGYVTAGVLLFVSIVGYRELASALAVKAADEKTNLPEIIGLLAVCIHYILLIIKGADMAIFLAVIMGLFVAESIVFVFSYPKYKANQMIGSVFSFIYAPMMLSFIYLLRSFPTGKYLAWLPFIAWICDTFAYFTGRALGKHKLCPVLSPKKTIEGAIGGIAGSLLAGVIYGYVYASYADTNLPVSTSIATFAVITFVAGALSQVGDLIASGIKRDQGIKDYGNLIPGHGGIMDRFDSVIFITPVIYFLAKIMSNM